MDQSTVRPSDICFDWVKKSGIKAKISGVIMLSFSIGLCIAIVWILASLIQVVIPSLILGCFLAVMALYTISFLAWPWVARRQR